MKNNSIDTVLQIRLSHEPGTLARLAAGVVKHAQKSGMAGTAAP